MRKLMTNIVNKEDVEKLLRLDDIFTTISRIYGVPPNWQRPADFVSLCKIILEQQVSLASAKAHFIKLNIKIKEFTPVNILKLTDKQMRKCQISRQKAKYLRALSEAVLNNGIDFGVLNKRPHNEVKEKLTSIKGIGDWTADIYLLFCLQSKDVFPIGDIAVVNTVRELTNASTREEILKRAERWRPLRSLATYFLWHYYLKKRNRTV